MLFKIIYLFFTHRETVTVINDMTHIIIVNIGTIYTSTYVVRVYLYISVIINNFSFFIKLRAFPRYKQRKNNILILN